MGSAAALAHLAAFFFVGALIGVLAVVAVCGHQRLASSAADDSPAPLGRGVPGGSRATSGREQTGLLPAKT